MRRYRLMIHSILPHLGHRHHATMPRVTETPPPFYSPPHGVIPGTRRRRWPPMRDFASYKGDADGAY